MRKAVVFIAVLLLMTAGQVSALPLRVEIINGTKDEPLAGFPFRINVFDTREDGSVKLLKGYEFRTDPEGLFTGEVEVTEGRALAGEVNYKGVSYYSTLLRVKDPEEGYTLRLKVYEITDDRSGIEIVQRTMMITPQDDRSLWVTESIVVENPGRLTYVGRFNDELKTHQVLFIPLPSGYRLTNLEGADPQRVYTFTNGIVTQDEIIPGRTTLFLGYIVRSDIGLFDLSLRREEESFPIRTISVYFQNKDGWNVRSTSLSKAGEKEFGRGIYGVYSILAGENLRGMRLKVTGPSYRGAFGIWLASIPLAFLLAGAGLYAARERIQRHGLVKEKARLEGLLERLRNEASPKDLDGYYLPFRKTLEERLREIEGRLKG